MAQRRKKFKGFKVVEIAYYSFDGESDEKIIRQMYQCKNSVEKCAKTTQNSPKKCVKSPKSPSEKCDFKGEYCPKVTGCCWDYTQKKKIQKQEEEDKKNAA